MNKNHLIKIIPFMIVEFWVVSDIQAENYFKLSL